MPFSEFEQHRYEKLLQDFCEEHGPPPNVHDKLQWGYIVNAQKQTIELFEIRPRLMDPSQKVHIPIAKARYTKSQALWKVYWMRGTGKWDSYPSCPTVADLEGFLKLLREDNHQCFFG